ncbi:MAG: hypothetical protein ACI4EF_11855 [Coprococcus sp.]
MILAEIKKIINRKQFFFVCAVLLFSIVIDFVLTCRTLNGAELTHIRGAYKYTILNNMCSFVTSQIFLNLLPVVACLIGSDIYFEEYSLGITNFVYSRESKKKDIISKAIALVFVVFFVVFSVLMINLFLSLLTFPLQGHASANTTYLTLCEPEANRILSWLEAYHPYINIIVFMFFRSIMAALFALFAFAFSLMNKGNRYIILLTGFIYDIIYENIMGIPNSNFFNTNIMGVNTYGSVWAIVLFLVITFVVSLCMLITGVRKDTV